VLKKKCGNGVPTPNKKTATNSSNKVSIRLQEFPHRIFPFHCRFLTSSANLDVAITSVRSRPYFNVIVWISYLQVTLLVASAKRCGNVFPPNYTPESMFICTTAGTKQGVSNSNRPLSKVPWNWFAAQESVFVLTQGWAIIFAQGPL